MCDESVGNATEKIPGSRKTSQWHLSSLGEGPRTGQRAALITVASPGLSAGHSELHTHTQRLPLSLGYKGNRNAVARGGSCILRREMVLPPGRGRRRESGRATQPLTQGGRTRRALRASPGMPSRDSPAPRFPPLRTPIFGRGRFISRGREGKKGSRLLTWAPRFC